MIRELEQIYKSHFFDREIRYLDPSIVKHNLWENLGTNKIMRLVLFDNQILFNSIFTLIKEIPNQNIRRDAAINTINGFIFRDKIKAQYINYILFKIVDFLEIDRTFYSNYQYKFVKVDIKNDDCYVCFSKKSIKIVICNQCKNYICNTCYNKLQSKKCGICRHEFPVRL